jgi:chemotaxis protein MotA
MNMVLQGISMMCERRSPGFMRETLKSFAAHYQDEIFDGRMPGKNGEEGVPAPQSNV